MKKPLFYQSYPVEREDLRSLLSKNNFSGIAAEIDPFQLECSKATFTPHSHIPALLLFYSTSKHFFISVIHLIMEQSMGETIPLLLASNSNSRTTPAASKTKRFGGILLALLATFIYSLATLILKSFHTYHPFTVSIWRFQGMIIPSIPVILLYSCLRSTKERGYAKTFGIGPGVHTLRENLKIIFLIFVSPNQIKIYHFLNQLLFKFKIENYCRFGPLSVVRAQFFKSMPWIVSTLQTLLLSFLVPQSL